MTEPAGLSRNQLNTSNSESGPEALLGAALGPSEMVHQRFGMDHDPLWTTQKEVLLALILVETVLLSYTPILDFYFLSKICIFEIQR